MKTDIELRNDIQDELKLTPGLNSTLSVKLIKFSEIK